MNWFFREFVSDEKREYKFKLGKKHASSLAGFVCGAVFTLLAIIGTAIVVYFIELSMM